jgi:hypothetical protein
MTKQNETNTNEQKKELQELVQKIENPAVLDYLSKFTADFVKRYGF